MTWSRRPRRPHYPTPFGDLLWTLDEVMPTWNRHRGHLGMDGKRKPGGEWDYIRSIPLRTRRRLTAAGFMAKGAMGPDEFADHLRNRVPGLADKSDGECHAWYVRIALLALAERQRASRYDRKLALARAEGAPTYYALRDARAWLAGYDSYFDQRNEQAKAAGFRSYWHQRNS